VIALSALVVFGLSKYLGVAPGYLMVPRLWRWNALQLQELRARSLRDKRQRRVLTASLGNAPGSRSDDESALKAQLILFVAGRSEASFEDNLRSQVQLGNES